MLPMPGTGEMGAGVAELAQAAQAPAATTGCQLCLLWQQQVAQLQTQVAQLQIELQTAKMRVQSVESVMLQQPAAGGAEFAAPVLGGDMGMGMGGALLGMPGAMPGLPMCGCSGVLPTTGRAKVWAGDGGNGFFAKAAEENPFHKTSLCKRYQSPGGCTFGDKCNFAHGPEELRQKPSNPVTGVNPLGFQQYEQGMQHKRMRPDF